MVGLKDCYIPTVFFSNLVIFVLTILYRHLSAKNPSRLSKNKGRFLTRSHLLLIFLYLFFASWSYSQIKSQNQQYYRVLNIPREYKPEQIAKANRKILRRLHPDLKGGDQLKYMIHNETMEVFKKMPKSLLRIYNMFQEDVFVLFSNKSVGVTYKSYLTKKENDSMLLHGFCLLLTLFVLKFARLASQKMKLMVLLTFGLIYLSEAAFYNYFDMFDGYDKVILGWIQSEPYFADFTYFEVLTVFQICLFGVQQLLIVLILPFVIQKPILVLSSFEQLNGIFDDKVWFGKSQSSKTGKF